MKKILFVFTLCLCLLCFIPQLSASADSTPAITSNEGSNEPIYYWSDTMTSYLYDNGAGLTRVEYLDSKADTATGAGIVIEKYDSNYNLLSSQTLEMELPVWGGFYNGTDYNFIFVGQNNPNEDDSVEVIRVIRYTKDWKRVDSVGLYGANTYIPFDAGSLRAVQYEDMLYVRTAHEMYESDDGLHHQANLTFSVKIGSTITITDSFYGVLNKNYGYCSHSFNQFIDVHGNTLIGVDHGDAYPRSIAIFKYNKPAGEDKFFGYCSMVNAFPIYGSIGANYTGVSVGGFEISDSSYLIAGRSIDQDSSGIYSYAENIFVTSTPINNFTDAATTITWLTNNTDENTEISTPQLVKISGDRLLVMWTEGDNFRYTFLDASGKPYGTTYTADAQLSDCKPIVCGNKVRWYVTDGFYLKFYEIDLSSPSTVKTAKTYVDTGIKLTLNIPVDAPSPSAASLYSFTAPADGTYIFTSLGNADTRGYLFDKLSNNTSDAILSNDYRYDWNTGTWLENFYMEYAMKKGETVYLRVSSWYVNGEYPDYQVVVKQKDVPTTTTKTTTTTTTKKPTTTTTTKTTTTTTTKKPTTTTTTKTTTTTTTKKPTTTTTKTTTTTTTKKPTTTTTTKTTTTTTTKKPTTTTTKTTTTTTTKKPTTTTTKTTTTAKPTTSTTTKATTTTTTTRPTNVTATVTRIAGGSRTQTAVAISDKAFKTAATVILADGNGYADSLAGVPLAYALDAPILLVRNSKLDADTTAEITRLGAKKVIILGGELAISKDVVNTLQKMGITVERIAGKSRFDTAVEIAKKLESVTGKKPTEVFFAFSHGYADALSIGGVAAVKKAPILYIAANSVLSDGTKSYLQSSGAKTATILGGKLAIAEAAEGNIKKAGASSVSRVFGQSRYATCIEINKKYASVLTGSAVCVATGMDYPDALAGGVFAAKNGAPLVLVPKDSLTDIQTDYISSRNPENIYIFGGTVAVSKDIEDQLKNL